MHRFLSMKASIDYLHIPLTSRLRFTQNECKTSFALVTTQISIWACFFINFETQIKHKIHSKTEFWEPLNEDNNSDIIIALQNWLCYLFVTLLSLNGSRHPPIREIIPHQFSLRLPFQKFASSPRPLQRHPYGISRFPSPEQQWNGKRQNDKHW